MNNGKYAKVSISLEKKPKNNRRGIFFSQFIVPKRIVKNSLLISIS